MASDTARGGRHDGVAGIAATLEQRLVQRQQELEGQRGNLRKELFTRQDEVEAQRNDLIGQLENQLQQRVEVKSLFTVEWELM